MPPENGDRDRDRGGSWWRLERIEERQKDILGKLEHLGDQVDTILKHGNERGWKIDAVLNQIERGIREAKEAVDRRAVLTNPDIVKILVAGLIALAGGNVAVRAFFG